MTKPTILKLVSFASLGLGVLLSTAGCATPPATAERLVAVPKGTVTSYHRKSSGSLGVFDGEVVWTHADGSWQGKPVISFGSKQGGVGLHEPVNFGLVANLAANGSPTASYEPPIAYQWPLEVGKAWTSSHAMTVYPSGNKVDLRLDWKVESFADVTVPAGTYKAYKVVSTNHLGEYEVRWVSPAAGIATVKRHIERPASHPQGAGMLDAELLSVAPPAPPAP